MRRSVTLVLLMVLTTACMTACSDEPDEARTTTCVSLGDDAREAVEMAVEDVIWERRLYETDKKVPEELLRDDRPIPLADMTDAQRREYLMWKKDNDAYLDSAQETLNEARDRALALNVVGACVDSAGSEEPEVKCIDLADEVEHAVIASVEQLIWEHDLYETDRPLPKELLNDGKKESIFEMDKRERALYDGWKVNNRAFARSTEALMKRTDASARALDVKDRCLSE